MFFKEKVIWCLVSLCLANTQAWFLKEFFNRFNKAEPDKTKISTECKEHCDENQLLLQLARLYVTSPERIILLLSSKSLKNSCKDVADVLSRINVTLTNSEPLPPNNLYMKLYDALDYFNIFICHSSTKTKAKHVADYQDCFRELREDLIECEGPPDWFEKSNEAIVCQYFNDIINCNYVKAALLCGLKSALLLRNFSTEIIKRVVPFKCRVSGSLPHVDNPMPSKCSSFYNNNTVLSIYIVLLLVIITII